MYYWWYADWYGHSYPGRPERAAQRDRLAQGRPLERAVADALLNDDAVRGGRIDLSVQNGVVILEGEVDTEEARGAAVARAWTVPGVTDVCNALTVRKRWFRF